MVAIVTLVGAALALAYFNTGRMRLGASLEVMGYRNAATTIPGENRNNIAAARANASYLLAAAAASGGATAEAVDITSWLPVPEEEIKRRCSFTIGEWCGPFLRQRPIAWKPPPLGRKICAWDCSFSGVCDGMQGWCRCVAHDGRRWPADQPAPAPV